MILTDRQTDRQTERELTGYPSIDKPWLSYYGKETVQAEIPQLTLYGYLRQCNELHQKDMAINYFGKRISYARLFGLIDQCAAGLSSLGVKEGDVVSLCLMNTPEAAICLYAISKIGAVANMMHILGTEEEKCALLKEAGSAVFICQRECRKQFEMILRKTSVNTIIETSFATYLPVGKRMLMNIKASKDQAMCHVLSWAGFMKLGTQSDSVSYKPNQTVVIERTGGTTGIPKGVELTNENLNAIAVQYHYVFPHKRQERFLNIMPPFYAYGVIFGMHMPLCEGLELILMPKSAPEGIPKIIKDYRPNHFVAGDKHLLEITQNKKYELKDYSFLITLGMGGTELTEVKENRINEFLKCKGCQYPMMMGYGMTELASTACSNTHNHHAVGSVGIPLPFNDVKIVDPDTGISLQYGAIGEIWISGPSVMKGYWHHAEETKQVISMEDGKRWMHTGDLGYVTKEGFVYISGRIKRIYFSIGENKIPSRVYPAEIENVINKHPAVTDCAVIGIPHETKAYVGCAYVVKNDFAIDEAELTLQIIRQCKEQMSEYAVPEKIMYLEQLPRTGMGKVDFRKLEQMSGRI